MDPREPLLALSGACFLALDGEKGGIVRQGMELLFATTNENKLAEMRAFLRPASVSVLGLDVLKESIPEPVEDGATFEENARIKASAYAKASGMICLADDSGLEVDALGGAPGVLSARYAGVGAGRQERDRANRDKLIAELSKLGEVPRSARLVCCLCVCDAEGRVQFASRGVAEGEVIDEPRGAHGFGYDTHLFLPDVEKTAAELSPDEWNARSHRGGAVKCLLDWLGLPLLR